MIPVTTYSSKVTHGKLRGEGKKDAAVQAHAPVVWPHVRMRIPMHSCHRWGGTGTVVCY